jgi:Fe-S cluster assembly scaffold protein SufB
MENNGNLIINKLPAKTWYWLGVNDARIHWDVDKTTFLKEETLTASKNGKKPERITVKGKGEYSTKVVKIDAKKDSSLTVYMDYSTDAKLGVRTEIAAGANSVIRLVQFAYTKKDSLLFNEIIADCAKNARVELIQIFLGLGDIYADSKINLSGEGSSLKADIGYLGQHNQKIDVNIFANHTGKKTESEINVNGALRDAASKVFKGTIDFKNGCTDSVGNEQETVLMLGEDVVNKTIPLILCAEENVVGNHGATIGELDEDTLFYFESRGIGKEQAENILARAAIEHLSRMTGDETTEKAVEKALGEVL